VSVSDSGNTDRSYGAITFLANPNSIWEPGATVIVTNLGPDNIGHVLRIGDTTGSTGADWAAVQLDPAFPAPNFRALMTTNPAFPVGSVTTNTLGASNLGGGGGGGGPTGSIVSQGTVPPGVPAGGEFISIRPQPKINASDKVIFRSWLRLGFGLVTAASDTGIWYQDGAGTLTLAAREGNAAAGVADSYGSFNFDPAWSDSGTYAFSAYLLANHSGIWEGVSGGGAPALVLRGNDPAPGVSGALVASLANAVGRNQSGSLVTRMFMKIGAGGVTSANDGAVLAGPAGNLQIVAREGTPAPGTSGYFSGLMIPDWVRQDSAGRVLFTGVLCSQLQPTTINAYNNTGIWMKDGLTTQVVAIGGMQAQGLDAGIVYFQPRWGVLAAGKVAFRSNLRGTGVLANLNDAAVFAGAPGSLAVVARTGVTAGPGAPVGAVGAAFAKLGLPRIGKGASQSTAHRSELKAGVGGVTTANNEGIWAESGGTVEMIVREGASVPGVAGVFFGPIGEPYVGENGAVCFTAKLTGAGIAAANDSAWFCKASGGGISMLLREGQSLPTDAGPCTVADVQLLYASPEEERVVNVAGTMSVQIRYTNGRTGIAIIDLP
jgi:hypothetical protein